MQDFVLWLRERNPEMAENALHTLGATGITAAGMLGGGALGLATGGVPGALLGGLLGKKAGEHLVPDDWKLKAMQKKMKKKMKKK